METAVANLVEPGKKALVVVTGYFGLRLADIAQRYGAEVRTVECEWGRAIDPAAVESALAAFPADIVAIVHAETSTGVRNPVREVAALAHARGALVIADCVTSLGGQEVDMAGWGLDVVYSGAQKCLGAPSGLAPIAVCAVGAGAAGRVPQLLLRRRAARGLLGRPQVPPHDLLAAGLRVSRGAGRDRGRRPRGPMGAPRARCTRPLPHGVEHLGLSFLVPADERLMTLNTVRVPDGVDEAKVRTALRERFSIEIGAGMGPLAGKIWRIGLMGASATEAHVLTLVAALRATMPH